MNHSSHRKNLHSNNRQRDSTNNLLFPERNAATGFTMPGMFMLLGLIVFVALINYLFL